MTPTKITPPDLNSPRVLRGGCWRGREASWVRAGSRNSFEPANRFNGVGFRCALRGREPR